VEIACSYSKLSKKTMFGIEFGRYLHHRVKIISAYVNLNEKEREIWPNSAFSHDHRDVGGRVMLGAITEQIMLSPTDC